MAQAVRPFLNGRTIDDPISVDNISKNIDCTDYYSKELLKVIKGYFGFHGLRQTDHKTSFLPSFGELNSNTPLKPSRFLHLWTFKTPIFQHKKLNNLY